MAARVRWTLIALIVCLVAVAPVVYYRAQYAHSKRLRVVEEGRVYRSGQLTAEGFRDAVSRLGIRTIVNLQEDYPDPNLAESFLGSAKVKESQVCRELGVKFVSISPDLVPRRQCPPARPGAVEQLLEVLDDPTSYPLLLHCRAGLHRTGCAAAIYRMEYQGWTPKQAVEEMRRHGFGDQACTAANDYVYQYVLTYRQGLRRERSAVNEAGSAPNELKAGR